MSHRGWAAVALIFSTAAALAAAPDVLTQARSAAGGVAWERVPALQAQGRITASGLNGTWSRAEDLSRGRWAVREDLGVFRSASGDDGQHRWRQDASGGVHSLNGAYSLRAAITDAWLTRRGWLRADVAGASLSPITRRSDEGHDFDVLRATPKGGEPVDLWFDAHSHLLARTVRELPISLQTVRYADYRRVAGLQLPFRIETRDSSSSDVETVQVDGWRIERHVAAPAYAAPTPPDDTLLQAETTVPLEIDGMVVVQARVNGRAFDFILDTGGHNILTPDAVRSLGLQPVGAGASGGAGEGSLSEQYVRVEQLQIGDASMRDQHFYVLPLQYGTVERGERAPLAGILGLEIFERFFVRLDYPAKTMTLRKLGNAEARIAGTPVPIRFDDDMPLLDGRIDGVPGVIALDTGNSGTTVVQGVWARQHGLAERLKQGIETVSYGAGGASPNWASRLQSLEIGGHVIERPLARYAEDRAGAFSSRTEAANIGTDILATFVLHIDYRAGVIGFERRPGISAPPFNRAGLRAYKESAESFRVAVVTPDSPAARAGVSRDDRIIAVDGVPAARLSGRQLFDKLIQPVGTELHVTLKRGSEERHATLRLAEMLP